MGRKMLKIAVCMQFLCLCVPIIFCNEMKPPNTEGWIDPEDIFIQDKIKLRRVNSEKSPNICHEELQSCLKERAECEKGVKDHSMRGYCDSNQNHDIELSHSDSNCKDHAAHDDAAHGDVAHGDVAHDDAKHDDAKHYVRRFVNMILRAMKHGVEGAHEEEVVIVLKIPQEQMGVLQNFGKGHEVSLRSVDEILSDVFVGNIPFWYSLDLGIWSTIRTFMSTLVSSLLSSEVWSALMCILIPSFFFIIVLMITKRLSMSLACFFIAAFLTSYITVAMRVIKKASLESSGDEACRIPSHLGVTSVGILSRMFGELVADMSGHGGIAVVNFFSEINANFGFFERLWVIPTLLVLCALSVLMVVVGISGGMLHLPLGLGGIQLNHRVRAQGSSSQAEGLKHDSSSQSALPSTSAPTINLTVNYNGNRQSDEISSIPHFTKQQALSGKREQAEISNCYALKSSLRVGEGEGSVSPADVEEIKPVRIDQLSAGDRGCMFNLSTLPASSTNTSSKLSYNESQDVFKFTASSRCKEPSLRGRYKSGKPPTKVLVLERERHNSL